MMRRIGALVLALGALSLAAGDAPADPMKHEAMKSNAAYERMKSLVGDWVMPAKEGKPTTVTFALISGGSALMETLTPQGESPMTSVYHPDGDRLLMTHYCHAQNQPRMRAETLSADGKTLAFEFVDVTNLAAPDAVHMRRLVVTFVDADHFSADWTWKGGEKSGTHTMAFERRKS